MTSWRGMTPSSLKNIRTSTRRLSHSRRSMMPRPMRNRARERRSREKNSWTGNHDRVDCKGVAADVFGAALMVDSSGTAALPLPCYPIVRRRQRQDKAGERDRLLTQFPAFAEWMLVGKKSHAKTQRKTKKHFFFASLRLCVRLFHFLALLHVVLVAGKQLFVVF